MSTVNQKNPSTTASPRQPVNDTEVAVAQSAKLSSMATHESSQSEPMSNGLANESVDEQKIEKSNNEVTQLPSSSTESDVTTATSTIDNKPPSVNGAETTTVDQPHGNSSIDADESQRNSETTASKTSSTTTSTDANLNNSKVVVDTNGTKSPSPPPPSTPVDAIEKRDEPTKTDVKEIEKTKAQCDSVDSLETCNDSDRRHDVGADAQHVHADDGGVGGDSGANEKCNEIDKNDSKCDSSDILCTVERSRQPQAAILEPATNATNAVTVETKLNVNESNNNDIIDESKIESSKIVATTTTTTNNNNNDDSKSDENPSDCVARETPATTMAEAAAAPTAETMTTPTTRNEVEKSTENVKNDERSSPLDAQATANKENRGECESTNETPALPAPSPPTSPASSPRNAISVSVIADSRIKKTCDLLDERTRAADRPEQNAITSSSCADDSVQPVDTVARKHSNDGAEAAEKSYERKIIVSPPKSSTYQSQAPPSSSSPFGADQKTRPTSSLYVSAPDFSKQLHAATAVLATTTQAAATTTTSASAIRDFSPLRMKAPDFSKLYRTTELHVSNPDFTRAYDRVPDTRPKQRAAHPSTAHPPPSEVNASNFAEVRERYNYVSDLQLKNPLPATSTSSAPTSSMYVRPPDFSSSKIRSTMEKHSVPTEEPRAHVIHKPKFRIQADSSSKSTPASPVPAPIMHNEYPQLSHDVTMSLVSSQQRRADTSPIPPPSNSPMQNGNVDSYAMRHERHRFSGEPVAYYAAAASRPVYPDDSMHHRQSATTNYHSSYPHDGKSMQQPVISRPIPIHQNYHRPFDVHAGSHTQMNPPPISSSPKWPSQPSQSNRIITQSPISLASSPHSVSSQSTNQLYPSPHATPSPSSFGYPAAPSPVAIKHSSSPLLSNTEPTTMYRHPTPTMSSSSTTSSSSSPAATHAPKSQRPSESSKKPSTKTSKDSANRASDANTKVAAKPTDTNYSKFIPNYRHANTIVDPFVYRQSSEADLNYQIIKKTLNKEIPVPSFNRRPDAPPPTAMPMPSRNSHHIPHDSIEMRMRKNVETESKLMYLDHQKPQSAASSSTPSLNHVGRVPPMPAERSAYPQTNGIGSHHHHRPMPPTTTSSSHNSHHYPSTSQMKMPNEQGMPLKIVSPSPSTVSSTKPTSSSSSSGGTVTAAASSSMLQPTQSKRESPLDLSVKTVKTKADSTGVYDYSVSSAKRPDTIPPSLKVDFSPNFGAGQSVRRPPESSRASTQQPSSMYARTEQLQPIPSKAPMHRPYEMHTEARSRPREVATGGPIMIFGQKPEELKNFPPVDANRTIPSRPNSHRNAMGSEPVPVIASHPNAGRPKEAYPQQTQPPPAPAPAPLPPSSSSSSMHLNHGETNAIRSNRPQPSEVIHYAAPNHHPSQFQFASNDYRRTHESYPSHPPPPQTQSHHHFMPQHPMNGSVAPPPRHHPININASNSTQSIPNDALPHRKRLTEMPAENIVPTKQPRYNYPMEHQMPKQQYPLVQPHPQAYPPLPPVTTYYGHMPPADAAYHHHMQQQHKYHQMRIAMHPPPPPPSTVLHMTNRGESQPAPAPAPAPKLPAPIDNVSNSYQSQTKLAQHTSPMQLNQNNNIYPGSAPPPQSQSQPMNHTIRHTPSIADYAVAPTPYRQPYPPASNDTQPKANQFSRPADAAVSAPLIAASAIGGGSSGNLAAKGADQTVISKLRINLELKEIEKQKVLKSIGANDNSSSSSPADDDQSKSSEIASIIAARIRTKGELKGFTPLPPPPSQPSLPTAHVPVVAPPQPKAIEAASQAIIGDGKKNEIVTAKVEVELTPTPFDLNDWGSACNDFLMQLQSGGSSTSGAKKRLTSKRRSKIDESPDTSTATKETPTAVKSSAKTNESSSDDEDDNKPLHLLRQQSLSENSKSQKSENDSDPKTKSNSSNSSPSSKKNPSKIAKEKQRDKREQEKRLLSRRISSTSSSDSEQDGAEDKRQTKKIIRKPRTRASLSNHDDEHSDNGVKSNKNHNRNGNSKAAEQKKRNRSQSSSDSDDVIQKPAKRNKTKQLIDNSSSSDNNVDDDDENDNVNNDTDNNNESSRDAEDTIPAHVVKKKKHSTSSNGTKVEETMTRSKRKRELETQIANSKVLRNDKMIECVAQSSGKSTTSTTTPTKRQTKSTSETSTSKGQQQQQQQHPNDAGKSRTKKRLSATADSDNDDSKSPIPKRKNTRSSKIQSSSSSESEESTASEPENVTERLRSRKAKVPPNSEAPGDEKAAGVKQSKDEKPSSGRRSSKSTPKKGGHASTVTTATATTLSAAGAAATDVSDECRFQPGWEEEVYEYKRSLKIPPSLITIGRPSWHRKSTSLPDLDPQHSSDASESFEIQKKIRAKAAESSTPLKKRHFTAAAKKTIAANVDEQQARASEPELSKTKSIIDVLHQRVSRPVARKKLRHPASLNEPKLLPQSNEAELLPTPGTKGDVFKPENVFETAVLKSRTRKEYRALKNQEIIREVFGGEDRPASAPPAHFDAMVTQVKTENVDEKEKRHMTFDQQYEQYVKQMNVDFGEKIRKLKCIKSLRTTTAAATSTSTTTSTTSAAIATPTATVSSTPLLVPKVEKMDEDSLLNADDDETRDTELNECSDANKDATGERVDTPSVLSEAEGATPTSFKGLLKSGKKARSNRRKGSSGKRHSSQSVRQINK